MPPMAAAAAGTQVSKRMYTSSAATTEEPRQICTTARPSSGRRARSAGRAASALPKPIPPRKVASIAE